MGVAWCNRHRHTEKGEVGNEQGGGFYKDPQSTLTQEDGGGHTGKWALGGGVGGEGGLLAVSTLTSPPSSHSQTPLRLLPHLREIAGPLLE